MRDIEELKPCPFCCGEAQLYESRLWGGVYTVVCTSCGATVGDDDQMYGTSKDDVVKLWNRRGLCYEKK